MLFENDVDDDSGYSLEMGWLCSEIADDWQVLFLCVLPKMTRGKTLKSEKIDGTQRMDGFSFWMQSCYYTIVQDSLTIWR